MITGRLTRRLRRLTRSLRRLIAWILAILSALLDLCMDRRPGLIVSEVYPGIRSEQEWRRIRGRLVMIERIPK